MCCRLTIFLVYNAYPERSKTETWEKRLTCISWMFGCYKTMIQQVEGRQACCSHHILRHTVHKQMLQTKAYCPAVISFDQAMHTMEARSAIYSSQPQKLLVSLVPQLTYRGCSWHLHSCAQWLKSLVRPAEGQVLLLRRLYLVFYGAFQVSALDQCGAVDVRPVWARRPHAF